MGRVSAAKLDTFNFPIYYATPQQLKAIFSSNQSFTIERMEILRNPGKHTVLDVKSRAAAMRAVHGKLLTDHFGSEIVDELFEVYVEKLAATPIFENPDNDKTNVVLVVLKRKIDY
ncbi:hypothetical protein CASFOL_038466 [Castilleja foliolosa]|uniref:SAM dependent carboxyl methyltransferase n=1 Tax=Castilleja foliolosa TaxID=1961234 RepID=A0ABD3BN54_9LAMI